MTEPTPVLGLGAIAAPAPVDWNKVATGGFLNLFLGYDTRQPVSFTVLLHSILSRSKRVQVRVTPLTLATLPIQRQGLTQFTYSRFLTPYLMDFKGWALFADVDVAFNCDVAEVFAYADESKAVIVNKSQPLRYEWPSVMLFNCGHPANACLTPDMVQNTAKPLHLMGWLDGDDSLIGDMPPQYNHLVGYDQPNPSAKVIHYTQGVPCFEETMQDEHGEFWRREARGAVASLPWIDLMGNSVHAPHVLRRMQARQGGTVAVMDQGTPARAEPPIPMGGQHAHAEAPSPVDPGDEVVDTAKAAAATP